MVLHLTGRTDQSGGGSPTAVPKKASPFLETERAFHASLGGLTTDAQGREVLVGLTLDETVFYLTFIRAVGRERSFDRQVRDRHRSLRKRYESTRDGGS